MVTWLSFYLLNKHVLVRLNYRTSTEPEDPATCSSEGLLPAALLQGERGEMNKYTENIILNRGKSVKETE